MNQIETLITGLTGMFIVQRVRPIICPRDICPYQQYLSCYFLDLDQTLKAGSWDNLQQIPTVMVTFVEATYVLATFVHNSNISAITDSIWTKL